MTGAVAAGRVIVVVVTFNSADVVSGLIESLPAGLEGVDWHLVVADNASSDGTVETLRNLAPHATVVETGRNAGYAAGINTGVAAGGDHDAVLILNPDVRLRPGAGTALLSAVAEPGVGIAVPQILDADGQPVRSLRREPSVLRAWGDAVIGASRSGRVAAFGEIVTDPDPYARPCDVDWAEGSVQMVDATCWAECGPWDEGFFLYSEETEYHLRAGDFGWRVRYTPAAVAEHRAGDSTVNPGLWRLLTLNRVRLFRRRNGRTATTLFWLALVVRETSRAALGKATSRAAIRGLVSPRRWSEPPGPDAVAP